MLVAATPILFTGAAVAIAFRGGYWNIGAEGQLLLGAIAAAGIGTGGRRAAAARRGAGHGRRRRAGRRAWALVPALLRVRFGIDEVVTTLLLNPVALLLVNGCSTARGATRSPASPSRRASRSAEFPQLLERSRLHLGFLLAVAVIVIAWYVSPDGGRAAPARRRPEPPRGALRRHPRRPDAARGGPLVSGAIAGIAGVSEVAGIQYRLTSGYRRAMATRGSWSPPWGR